MVRFSDILGKITRKHGAKPTNPKPLGEKEFSRSYLGDQVRMDLRPGGAVAEEPTQELSKGIMEKLFQSVLDTPADVPAPATFEPPASDDVTRPPGRKKRGARGDSQEEIRGFRNHAELMKFASLLINDIEDALAEHSA